MDIKLKHNKDKHIKGSIFLILIRRYIFFTLFIILFGTMIYFLAKNHMRGIISEPLFKKLISYKTSMLFDKYQDIPVEQLLGKGSLIQVLNEKNEIIYESKAQIAPTEYTAGEISCIPQYNDYQYSELAEINGYDNNRQAKKVLIINHFGKNSSKDCYLLNANNQIINGCLHSGKSSFTDKELGYLTGDYPGNIWIQKYSFKNKDGKNRVMLLMLPVLSEHEYKLAFREIGVFAILFIAFYITLIVIFVYIINRQLNAPIKLLNNALLKFAEGKREGPLNYTGPLEFVKICDSFNIMSKRLSESEYENSKLTDEKNKMLADISHDLKTPITVIQGYSQALSDGLISDEKKMQYLSIIYKKSVLVGNLINKFYEYSKLEHPDYIFDFEKVDICEFSREYIAEKFEELRVNGYDMEVQIPDKRIFINADKMQMGRVYENLISNTVAHTPKGTQIIFQISEMDDKIEIDYYDNGGGIDENIAGHIFEPFVVEDLSRNKTGSGLGLSITQKIVKAHDGTILLISGDKKEITYFRIILPQIKE